METELIILLGGFFIELSVTVGGIVALWIKLEHRITKLETTVFYIPANCPLMNQCADKQPVYHAKNNSRN